MTDIIIGYDKNTNETISVSDSTDYTALGISVSDVNGIRYLFATYNSVLNASTVTSLVANHEYTVVSGLFAINGASYLAGQTFVAHEAFILPTSGVSVKETGYYCLPNLTIPSVQISSSYTPSQIGEDDTCFQDNFRYVRYEVYDLLDSASTDGLHLVQGTQGDYIQNGNGETYYVGDVYYVIVGDNDGYTPHGNAYPVKYLDGTTFGFWTDGNATDIMKTYNDSLANGTYNVSEDFRANYIKAVTCLSMPYIQSFTGATYSEGDIQNALDYVNTVLGTVNKNIRNA